MEDEIASKITAMTNSPVGNINESELNRFIQNIETNIGVHLFDEQRDAIIQLLKRNFGILQGPAGTGKTYLMKVLVKAWEALGGHCILGGSVELACLAGKAAMQLRRSANRPAYTLAGLLRYLHRRQKRLHEGREVPNHWPSLEPSTLLIVDEASMVDVGTWHELFDFMPPGCRLLMVGDNGQLPPVGIGQIYHDLVSLYPYVVKLTLNHRQKSKTGIPEIANAIREGYMPSFKNYRGADQGVQFYECPEDSTIKNVAKIKKEILSQVNEGEVLICAALRRTVDTLNESGAMQNHKLKIPLRAAPGVWIADGDPVVYTENRYKSELYNGLLGRVVQVNNNEEKSALIHWDGEDKPRKISGEESSGIDLAYAITVHKVQGSSAPRIIVPLERNRLVTRQWLYTAVTRAEEQCVFVGNKSLFSASLKRLTQRNTGFRLKDI